MRAAGIAWLKHHGGVKDKTPISAEDSEAMRNLARLRAALDGECRNAASKTSEAAVIGALALGTVCLFARLVANDGV